MSKTMLCTVPALAAAFALSGCLSMEAVVGASFDGERGENLALASNGARATNPAFIDGNLKTSGFTSWSSKGIVRIHVAEVFFPEPTRIDLIIVKSRDLDKPLQQSARMAIEYLSGDSNREWQKIKDWQLSAPKTKTLKASCERVVKGVRVCIWVPPSAVRRRFNVTKVVQREISEIEVYRYPEAEEGLTYEVPAPNIGL